MCTGSESGTWSLAAISDSGPLIRFAEVGRFDLLQLVFNEIVIPTAVYTEVVERGTDRPASTEVRDSSWITVVESDERVHSLGLPVQLGDGEREVLALARFSDDIVAVVLDDAQARRFGFRAGFPVIGTGGVLLLAKRDGHIDRVMPILDAMREAGLWISDAAALSVRRSAGE